MTGNGILLAVVLLPMVGSIAAYLLGLAAEKKGKRYLARNVFSGILTGVTCLLVLLLAWQAGNGESVTLSVDAVCDRGMTFRMDGFRGLYGLMTAFAWMMTTLFSFRYLAHEDNTNRYFFFSLFTLGATLGVFLSADLYTTFLFFEAMSLASYVWVAQEETADAVKASKTYLAVAVIGGLVMLMGLFLLQTTAGTLTITELRSACEKVTDRKLLYAAGGCLLFGFGAKAGCFPLHIWLPKAHPVAPAPASALLSGILTKSGIFGVLVLSGQIFAEDAEWGQVILFLGTVTMLVGAILALFSIDMKHILACSSVSQIGFILVGIGTMGILGEENALAVRGSMLHMMNHSLFKLILFLVAGVVVMNLESRDLNVIKGFGRKKPLFLFCFLMGALGIGGVPLFSGYVSKTLLHEGLVEAYHLTGLAQYKVYEALFLFSGGCTVAYMFKLFWVLFVEKPSKQVEEENAKLAREKKSYIGIPAAIAITVPSVMIPVFGTFSGVTMNRIADAAQNFVTCGEMTEEVEYFSLECLKGGAVSIAIGAVLYLLVVRPLITKRVSENQTVFVNRYPEVLSLEDRVYEPVLMHLLPFFGALASRTLDKLVDGIVYVLHKTILRPVYVERNVGIAETICNGIGHIMNGFEKLFNHLFRRKNPHTVEYVQCVNQVRKDVSESASLVSRSLSYGLLTFCIGLLIVLIYLMMEL